MSFHIVQESEHLKIVISEANIPVGLLSLLSGFSRPLALWFEQQEVPHVQSDFWVT